MAFNPIGEKRPFRNGFFVRIPLVEPGRAILLLSQSGGICCVDPSTTPSSIRKSHYDQMVSIVTQPKTIYVSHRPSCANGTYAFEVELKINARIIDPITIYQDQITDIEDAIFNDIRHDLDHIARRYKFDQCDSFEAAITDFFNKETQTQGIAFNVLSVDVSSDQRVKEVEDKKTEIEMAADIKKKATSTDAIHYAKVVRGDKNVEDIESIEQDSKIEAYTKNRDTWEKTARSVKNVRDTGIEVDDSVIKRVGSGFTTSLAPDNNPQKAISAGKAVPPEDFDEDEGGS